MRRPTDVVVTTSGRLHGRAAGGLGDLLATLGAHGQPAIPRPAGPERVWSAEVAC